MEQAESKAARRGGGKRGGGLNETGLQKILKPLREILERGNTAEVKAAKDGVLVLEVEKKVAVRGVEVDG